MKKIIFLITLNAFLSACVQSANQRNNNETQTKDTNDVLSHHKAKNLNNLLVLSEAEKILGEPAILTDSASTQGNDASMFQCAFKARSEDPKSKKTGVIYFLAEHYKEVSAAQKKYSFIKTANEKNGGVKVLNDLGDEAYFHSDGENFYFVMVRKGTKVFNMKINKITANTSLEEFNRVAKEITASL